MFSALATSSKSTPLSFGQERLINYFVEAATPAKLLGASGVRSVENVALPVRATKRQDNLLYVVAGGSVWKYDGATKTHVGTVPDDEGTQIAASGSQVGIVAGENFYVCDGTTTTEVTTGAVTSPIGVAQVRGYWIVIGQSGGRSDAFTWSTINDATDFDAFDFAFAESASDGLNGVFSTFGELWLFGTDTLEVWGISGSADLPFTPITGATQSKGCTKPRTIVSGDNSVFFVGRDGIVYRTNGGAPQVISTPQVKQSLDELTVKSATYFEDKGHEFYSIETNGTTFCYDVSTQQWSERSRTVFHTACSVTHAEFVGDVQYLGTSTGKIAVFDRSVFTDDGEVLAAEATSAAIMKPDRFGISRLTAMIESGQFDIDREAVVQLDISKDGANWLGPLERRLGRLGNYIARPEWHNLGSYDQFQARITITDPVQRDIIGVSIV